MMEAIYLPQINKISRKIQPCIIKLSKIVQLKEMQWATQMALIRNKRNYFSNKLYSKEEDLNLRWDPITI